MEHTQTFGIADRDTDARHSVEISVCADAVSIGFVDGHSISVIIRDGHVLVSCFDNGDQPWEESFHIKEKK